MKPDKVDSIFTILFMLLAVASVISYFAFDRTVFWYCGGAAVCVRLTQYFMRYIH